jgi:hypothetical protein
MNIANLSKLQGGYIHNPMITGKPIDMKKESDIFYEMKQEFNIMGYLTIDNTKILALLETIQKEYTEYGKTIDMIHKYFLEGTHKEYFIDLFKNQKITQIISEIAYINIDTIDLILVETLKQFKHLQSNILDIYIQILKDKNIYDKVLCEAKKKIEKDLNTNEIQVASLEGQQTITEKNRAKILEVKNEIQRLKQFKTDEKQMIGFYHQAKITDILNLSKLIDGDVEKFFEDLPINKKKDKIIKILDKYIDKNHYVQLDNIIKSYLNNKEYYDFSNYISVFHKLIPYYKTFDRLSFVYDESGNIINRTNFKLFRIIDGNYYLLTTYDTNEEETYKYFVINNSFIISEILVEPPKYFKKTRAIIPAIFKYSELVELFFNLLNNDTILDTFNDINKIYNTESIFTTKVKKIIDRSGQKDLIDNFNDIIKYLFINANDVMLPKTSENILNIFFYIGNLNFTFNILLNDNIYQLFDNIEFTRCIDTQLDETKESGKEISFETLLSEITKKITENNKINLETVIEIIQSIKTSPETKRYKLVLIYLVKKLYSNIMIRNCVPAYNFIYIYNMINMLETNYNKNFNISKIIERLKELNKWVSRTSNEDKVLFYLIFDILKCKVIFDKVSRMNEDIVIYAINTYMAKMIKTTNIPFNINIFSNHIKGRYHELRPDKVPTDIDITNKEVMNLFQNKFSSIPYKSGYVCNPINQLECRPDCGESSILNILIYLLFDEENMEIHSKWLPDNSFDFLKELFNKYNTIESINNKEVRINKFNRHLQGLEFVYQGLDRFVNGEGRYYVYQYPNYTDEKFNDVEDNKKDSLKRRVYDDMGNIIDEEIKYSGWELRPGYITVVRILNQILGYSKDKSPEESLDEKFLMKNLTEYSLKNILMTFKNPNIENILKNYNFNGNKYDYNVSIDFGKLKNINLTYDHAAFPEIENNMNFKIIGMYTYLINSSKKKDDYIYNKKRYYLLSDIEEKKFSAFLYLINKNVDLITIFLTPKNKITRKFRNLIYQFITNLKNKNKLSNFFDNPKLDYICELIKIYEHSYHINVINPDRTERDINWFYNMFKGFYRISIINTPFLYDLENLLETGSINYQSWIKLIENQSEAVFNILDLKNNTIGNIILSRNHIKLYNDLKDKIHLVTNSDHDTPLHIAYKIFYYEHPRCDRKIMEQIIEDVEKKYGKSNYNKKNIAKYYPIEYLLFSKYRYDEEFIRKFIKSTKVSTIIEIISNTYFKFNSKIHFNFPKVINILPILLEGNNDLIEKIYDLFIINSIINRIMNPIGSFDIPYILTALQDIKSINTLEDPSMLTLIQYNKIYKYYLQGISPIKFIHLDDSTQDKNIFPYIYNTNILNQFYLQKYIKDKALINKFQNDPDPNGDTIYHYIAKYTIYNYNIETWWYKRELYYFFEEHLDINNIINKNGFSVIDILSIVPIYVNIFINRESEAKQFLEEHFEFLNKYYSTNGFKPTNMVILHRHFISKYFYAFESANRLLTTINNYIKDKPDIDNYFICLLNKGLYLYKYCERLTSDDLDKYFQHYDQEKRYSNVHSFTSRNASEIFNGMITYEASVKPLHPFPKEIWYKLLPVNSPLSEFTIPIKNELKKYDKLIDSYDLPQVTVLELPEEKEEKEEK